MIKEYVTAIGVLFTFILLVIWQINRFIKKEQRISELEYEQEKTKIREEHRNDDLSIVVDRVSGRLRGTGDGDKDS